MSTLRTLSTATLAPRFAASTGPATRLHLVLRTAVGLLAALTASTLLAQPAPVTGERIVDTDEEPGNWLSHGRTYDEQRFSPLDQIDDDNVGQLGLAWTYDTGRDRGHEATPLVADGVLYLTTSWSSVQAVDLRTGEEKWVYDPEVPKQWGFNACCDVVNRGAALWGDHVFVGTIDGRLVKLDRETGDVAWDVLTIDPSKPYTITGAPRVVKGNVIIGNGGAEYGVRGYVSAYDAESGELAWRFYTVPGDPSKPFEHPELEMAAKTWTGAWWKVGGGGTAWDAMAYDPDLDLLYVGTGNGSPWPRKLRSPGGGDNLFLCSILALDPDTGRLVWHYQTTPADNWDYTSVQHIMLADLEIDGQERRVVMQAPKNGFFYVLDALTGELISAEKYAAVTWASHVDMETGRPVEIESGHFDDEPKFILPGPAGGHNWHPMAFHPETGLVYIPTHDQGTVYNLTEDFDYDPRTWNLGVHWEDPRVRALSAAAPDATGTLKAWDPVNQREVWSVPMAGANNGGLLATAGNLIFQGEPSGRFSAYSAEQGELLWSIETGVGIMAAPITYTLDGKQYVAVLAGWGGATSGADLHVSAAVKNTNPGRLFVFELGGDAPMPEVAPRYTKLDPAPEPFGTEEQLARGQDLFEANCGGCHGWTGQSSGIVSDLRYANRAVHENFERIVLDGRFLERGMPSFQGLLTKSDVHDIHAHLVTLAQDRPDPSELQAPPPEIPGLGAISRGGIEALLAPHGFRFRDGSERLGHVASRTAESGGTLVEVLGPAERPVRFTASWSGTVDDLEQSFEPMPEVLAEIVPWVGPPFFEALERDGHLNLEKDGTRVVAVVREGGERRMWFFEAMVEE